MAFKGYPTITQILIDGVAFINKPNLNQQTPLLVSCKQGHYPVAKLLIEGSCDLDWADVERKTPLIAAADWGHSRIVQLPVDAGLSNVHAFILFLFTWRKWHEYEWTDEDVDNWQSIHWNRGCRSEADRKRKYDDVFEFLN